MASAPKDDLLDLIFSAPINLPEVKETSAVKTNVAETDAQLSDDFHSNEADNSRYKANEVTMPAEEHVSNVEESGQISQKKVEGEFETGSEYFSSSEVEERHHVLRGSFVESVDRHDDISKGDEHSDAEGTPQVRQQHVGRDEVESGSEDNEINYEQNEQAAVPVRINVDIGVAEEHAHREEYIEEDVQINDTRNDYETESMKEEKEEPEKVVQHQQEEKAEAFLDYDRAQMMNRRDSIEEPNFKLDTDVSEVEEEQERGDEEYVQTEVEGYTAVAPKSRASTNASGDRMRYVESLIEEQQQNQQFYNDNVFMKKRDEYPETAQEVEDEKLSRRSSRSSYRAISVKRDSIASTQHDEVSSAPGVRNLKSIFERPDIPDNNKPQRDAHPPVIDYMNEEDYRQQYKSRGHIAEVGAEPVQHVEAPVAEEIEETGENAMVEEAEQKPVSELLSVFGGRWTARSVRTVQKSNEKEQKQEAAAELRAVNTAPMATTVPTQAATHPEKLPIEPAVSPQSQKSSPIQSSPLSPPHRVYLPPRPLAVKTNSSSSVRAVTNVRQFVKLWGQAPYTPGDPHPLSPVPAEMPITREKHEATKHSVKYTAAAPTNITDETVATAEKDNHHAEENKVNEVEAIKQKESKSGATHVISSENYTVEEVMIDDVPVSQRRKMFEQMESAPKAPVARRRSTKTLKSTPKVEQEVAQVEAFAPKVSKAAEVEESVRENTEHISRNEIEKGTEEIADFITHLTPVSERRKYFENSAEPIKGESAMHSRTN